MQILSSSNALVTFNEADKDVDADSDSDSDSSESLADDGLISMEDIEMSLGTHSTTSSLAAQTLSSANTLSAPDGDHSAPLFGFSVGPDFGIQSHPFHGTQESVLQQSSAIFPWNDVTMDLQSTRGADQLTGPNLGGDTSWIPCPSSSNNADTTGGNSSGGSTLILEDVRPETMNSIINALIESKAKVRMRLIS